METRFFRKLCSAAGGFIPGALFAAFFSALLPVCRLAAADWPMFRGNAARTGFASEQAYPPLVRAWDFYVPKGIVSSPVVSDGIVYFGARDKKLYALNAFTGAKLWQFQSGGWIDASPAVSSGVVYAVSKDGSLYALNSRRGVFLWKAALGAPSVSSPLVLDGKIYVGTESPEKKLKVFDAASGAFLGESPAVQPVNSAPSSDGKLVYFGANDGKLYALDKNTLSPVWSYQTMGGRYGMNAVAVSGGIVYALPGFDENKPLAFAVADGTLLNAMTEPFEEDVAQPDGSVAWEQVGSPVVSSDRLYFSGGSVANTLYALTSAPAAEALNYVWPSPPTLGGISRGGLLSSPSMADDLLYAGTVDGSLVAFSSDSVSVPLTADVRFSSPVYASPGISNGMIFVAGSDGRLSAYTASKVAAISNFTGEEVVSGTVAIKGYVSNPYLTGYTLEYSSGGTSPVWEPVVSSATVQPVAGGTLAEWNTTPLANGLYTLKLTVLESGAGGTDNTARAVIRVNAAPEAPYGLAVADVPADHGNQLLLGWHPSPAAGITAYRIYRSGGSGLAELASVNFSTQGYIDASAVTGSTFTYSVRAFDGYSESSDSNLVSAFSVNNSSDITPPAKITDLAAFPEAVGTLNLVWTAPGNDGQLGTASFYLLERSTYPGVDWNASSSTALDISTQPVGGPAGIREALDVTGLLGGVTYYFAIKAADAVPLYGVLSATAGACVPIDPVIPRPPSGLVAADTPGDGGGSLTLSWTLSPDDGATGSVYGYKLYRRQQNSVYVSSVPYAVVQKGVSSYVDNAAPENIRFYYTVAAFNSSNNSQLSNESYAVSANNWRFFDSSRGVSIRLADGARVDIQPNGVSQNDNILMIKLDAATYQPLFNTKASFSANPTGIVYEVKFATTTTRLLKPAVITLPYTDSDVAGMNLDNLRLYSLSGGGWAMVNTSKPDEFSRTVSAEVSHFSVYSIMEYVPSGALFSGDEVYTYPNPAKGDTLTFKFRVSDKSSVKIDVYNVAGQKVARFAKSGCPAGEASEIEWRIKNIASGVYQYRFEAVSAAGEKSVIKRLAVIH